MLFIPESDSEISSPPSTFFLVSFFFWEGGGKEIQFIANPYAEHTRPNVAITYVHR